MLSEDYKNKLILEMNEKNIKNKYQEYILKYIELNFQLFKFIDTDELIQRIFENFGGVSLNLTSFLYKDYGQYVPTTGKILLSPNLFFGKNKKYKETVFLHELDHCACSPTKLSQQYNIYKENITRKNKFLSKIIPDFVLSELFLKLHYEGYITGVANLERKKGYTIQKIALGGKLENYLNEGITSLKQLIYSKNLNIEFHKKKDFFCGGRKGAICLANIIGFNNMIYLHFNNDLEKIKKEFYDKTNLELDKLILKCLIYDNKSSKKNLKKLNEYIQYIYKKCDIKPKNIVEI